jgi:hypothetical protein
MALWSDIVGLAKGYLILGKAGVRLKTSAGKLAVRNAADSADALVAMSSLATGTPDGTKFVRDDGTLAVPAGGGSGDVVGPASATDNAIARFDTTTGKLIQNSGITIADGASGTLSGTNTGDQTSIVGITGTKAEFDTACSDGNFLFSGDVTQYTDELAQDAVGTILTDTASVNFTYNDATPSITADVIFGTSGTTACVGNDARLADDRTASGLRSASTVVSVSSATAPSSGQVLTATGSTAATWQTPAAGGGASGAKMPVRVATTANITLSGGAPNTLDGATLAANDRILVKNQSTASENGIYYVSTLGTGANGTWTRATDADGAGDLFCGMLVAASEGTANGNSLWMLTTNDPITIGTTALTFKSPNLYGTTTNDNAAAGMVGEYVESVVDEASAISLTSTTQINVTSISLTAGDWDVSCNMQFTCTATTNITELRGSVSLVSDTLDLTRGRVFDIKTAPHTVISTRHGLAGPTLRFSLASTTTIYLVAVANFTVSTMVAYGIISARRVR